MRFERPPTNDLLRLLPPEAFDRIAPGLKRETLRGGQLLSRPNQPIQTMYFPENCVLSLITVMGNGETLETGTVGREGASSVP
jgi:hypothetical protein